MPDLTTYLKLKRPLGMESVTRAAYNANLDIIDAKAILNGINVKYFGAVGDGDADDTAAIQAAIDVAHSANGGIVFVPAGIYMVSGLTMYSRISLHGAGVSTEIKLINTSSNNIITIVDFASDVSIKDIYLNGDITNNANAGHGICCPTDGSFIFKDIHIFNVKIFYCNRGIYMGSGAAGIMMSHLIVESCTSIGIMVPKDSELSYSYVGGNGTTDGWYAANILVCGWGNRVFANHFWDAPNNLVVEWIRFADIWGNKFENSYREGILIRGTCEGVRITENKFILCGSSATNTYNAIQFDDGGGPGARSDIISHNEFGILDNIPYHKYCIAEDVNSNDNYIKDNYYRYGYNTAPVLIHGLNTVSVIDIQ